MKSILRSAALAALSCSTLAFAGPAAAPAPAPAAKAAAPAVPAEYPLSCNAAAKPLFFKASDANFNARIEEARELLKQTIAADPKCAMAKAALALMTPGPEGKTLLDEANALAPTTSAVEKLHVQMFTASIAGEPDKAFDLAKQARDAAPTVLQSYLFVAFAAGNLQKFDDQLAAAKKATELSPKSGAAWNMVGYGYAGQNKADEAVAAFKKYAEVAPTEANAHDSLADAYLRNNQLDEAGASYQKAIEVSGGKFWQSWDGVATVKALKADWDGARAAIAKFKEGAGSPMEKLYAGYMLAWTWQAQGKPADALKALDAYEKESVAGKLELGALSGPTTRGMFLLQNGKAADALKAFTAAEKAKPDTLPGAFKKDIHSMRLVGTIQAHAKLNKLPAAEKALTELEALHKDAGADPMAADYLRQGKAAVALAKKDAKGAVEILKSVTPEADLGRLELADAQDAAGDGAGATETRTHLLKANHRNPYCWYAHARAEAKNKVPGKKVASEAPARK